MNDYEKLEQAIGLIREVQENLVEPPSGSLPPEEQWQFKDCNLWKPEGDHSNDLVILIRGDWPEPSRAEALRRDGSWESLQYTGLSNFCGPQQLERYTYRGQHPGGPHYAGKRKGGGVRVWYGNEFAFLPLPGPPSERHE